MENLVIFDISKISISYFCREVDKLIGNGFAKMNYSVLLDEIEGEGEEEEGNDIITAQIPFELLLNSEDITDETDKSNVDAKVEFVYKMVFHTSTKLSEINDQEVLAIIEPYIRKELYDFFKEVGLPMLPLPYRFWKNDKTE